MKQYTDISQSMLSHRKKKRKGPSKHKQTSQHKNTICDIFQDLSLPTSSSLRMISFSGFSELIQRNN